MRIKKKFALNPEAKKREPSRLKYRYVGQNWSLPRTFANTDAITDIYIYGKNTGFCDVYLSNDEMLRVRGDDSYEALERLVEEDDRFVLVEERVGFWPYQSSFSASGRHYTNPLCAGIAEPIMYFHACYRHNEPGYDVTYTNYSGCEQYMSRENFKDLTGVDVFAYTELPPRKPFDYEDYILPQP